MKQTAWAHLPNAKHIDWVIASIKAHPRKWTTIREAAWYATFDEARYAAKGVAWSAAYNAAREAAWDAANNAARVAAYDTAWEAVYNAARDAARDAARNATYNAAFLAACNAANNAARGVAYYAAWGTIVALIAYDDCAYMVESEVDEIKILAKLGDQRATLLLPACSVYNETKSITPLISYISKIKKCLFSI